MYLQRIRLPRARGARWVILLRLAPLILFFLATVGLGLGGAVSQSLGLSGPAPREGALAGYRALVQTPGLLSSVGFSLAVAVVSTAIAVALGAIGAYLLWRAPVAVQRVGSVYRLPIIMPHIVVAFLTVLIWSPSGLVAGIVAKIGVPSFPDLIYSANGVGIVLAYAYKEFPFVMLLCLGVLQRTPRRLVTTAQMLGAGNLRVFVQVILPLLVPALSQIAIILFLYALGGFDIPWLLGASRPQMIPVTVYSLYFQGSLGDRTTAMAALALLAVGAAVFTVVFSRIVRRLAPWERVV